MPEIAFDIERDDPKVIAMEKVAEALILAATEVVSGYLTPEMVAKLSEDREALPVFIQRNAIHLSASAIGNSAGFGGAAVETIMEALGTGIADMIAAQGPSINAATNAFMSSFDEKLRGHGLTLAIFNDTLPGEDAPEADDEKEPIQ